MQNEKQIAAIYVVKSEFLSSLCAELNEVSSVVEDLVFSTDINPNVCFAQDIWFEPQIVPFESISQAVKILKQAGKFWYLHPISHIRRSRLIEEQLRQYNKLERSFPIEEPIPIIGSFSLLDNNTLVFSTKRLRKWPQGVAHFIEDKINPPNRAYLKLWEALSLLEHYPKPGDKALDLGASPGGWTYVMQSLGTKVTAVDKAELEPKIAQLPNVSYLQQSAFALDPIKSEAVYDWVLSDVACYPDRAFELIKSWIASAKAKQLIVTIKLQGDIDLAVIKQFQAIPNSYLTNMYYNKHEVTFFHPYP